jgi:Gas vesicle synthesis protein GvpO
VTDDEQAAPRRMRRARSGRQEQRLPSAAREKVRRRHVPEDEEEEDDELESDELEDDEPADEPEDEPEDEQTRRPRPRRESAPRRRARPAAESNGQEERDEKPIPASVAARLATKNVVEFTGRELENVVAIERRDGDWYVDVEVVESHRIPDTTDILAIYQVRLDRSGDLLSYNRTRRYSRGQLDKESR